MTTIGVEVRSRDRCCVLFAPFLQSFNIQSGESFSSDSRCELNGMPMVPLAESDQWEILRLIEIPAFQSLLPLRLALAGASSDIPGRQCCTAKVCCGAGMPLEGR